MTNEEIAAEIKAADGAAPELMLELYENLGGWISKAIRPFKGYSDNADAEGNEKYQDLKQVAFLALYDAVATFKPGGGSFLYWYNTYYLKKALREYSYKSYGWAAPAACMDRLNGFKREVAQLEAELMRPATDQEIIERLKYEPEAVEAYRRQIELLNVQRLDQPQEDGEGNSCTLGDLIADGSEPLEDVIADRIRQEETAEAVRAAVDALPENQADAIRGEYLEGRRAADLAAEKGVTRQCIDGYCKRGLKRLSRSEQLRRLAIESEIMGRAMQGVGLRKFYETGTSATEREALQLYERHIAYAARDQEPEDGDS